MSEPPAPEDPAGPAEAQEPAAEEVVALDPFSGHQAFAGRLGMTLRPSWFDSPIQPIEPLDHGADGLVDFEVLEAFKHAQAGYKPPRAWRADKIEGRLEGWMKECEPQFNLRNLGRAERFSDPELPLPLERSEIAYGPTGDELKEVREARHEPPELLEDNNLALMARYRDWVRWLYGAARWELHFGHELKEALDVPLWRYDPFVPVEGEDGEVRVPAGDREPPPEGP